MCVECWGSIPTRRWLLLPLASFKTTQWYKPDVIRLVFCEFGYGITTQRIFPLGPKPHLMFMAASYLSHFVPRIVSYRNPCKNHKGACEGTYECRSTHEEIVHEWLRPWTQKDSFLSELFFLRRDPPFVVWHGHITPCDMSKSFLS